MSTKPRITPDMVVNALKKMSSNTGSIWPGELGGFPGRLAFASGKSLDPPNRDIVRECGYPTNPKVDYFHELIDQYGIAERANNIWPDETWGRPPLVYENFDEKDKTPFETAWNELIPRVNLYAMLHRVDRLCYGQYSGLLYGFSDLGPADKFDKPAPGIDPDTGNEIPGPKAKVDLNYVMAYSERSLAVLETEDRPGSPRFGQPKYYRLSIATPAGAASSERVHWTRVQHFVGSPDESAVYGKYRLKSAIPFIYDIRKVGGSSAEMFWKGGFPGYQYKVNQDPLMGLPEINVDEIREEIGAFMNGLQRFLTAENGEWESLAPQVADPTAHLTQQLQLLCATLGVPLMVFLGSMSGQLASNQNVGNWRERLSARQLNLIEPFLLRPCQERLIRVGVCPRPKTIVIEWTDLHALSGKERAEVALKLTQAMMQFVTGKCEAIMPVLYYYTQVLGLPNSLVQRILDAVAANSDPMTLNLEVDAQKEMAETQSELDTEKAVEAAKATPNTAGSGGRVGSAPNAPAGRPTGSV
jgi:hypothetical protein